MLGDFSVLIKVVCCVCQFIHLLYVLWGIGVMGYRCHGV